jgi:hypothetical protein
MKSKDAKHFSHGECHDCGPKDWADVPNITGDYDLDATILHRENPDLPERLELYVKRPTYGPRTAYTGYRGGGDN